MTWVELVYAFLVTYGIITCGGAILSLIMFLVFWLVIWPRISKF